MNCCICENDGSDPNNEPVSSFYLELKISDNYKININGLVCKNCFEPINKFLEIFIQHERKLQ